MTARRTSTRDIFIEGWGRLGPSWGINKMMAEIYALLYVSPSPLTLEEMSRQLETSRSNISTNVRALDDLGVVHKVIVRGERKDYYAPEDDITKVAKLLALAKKRKELDPAMDIVDKALSMADESGETEIAEKLEELKRHMDVVNAIFHAFVGGEADPKGLANVIRVKNALS
ncbi:MAG: transcriptional regulator [Candidatus Krumholzibacteria bacterium]|nr:transcriptional regulator [Candidatus Krumholzibacteria bacterium]MDH4337791.1 transcriptional regulator [Candidatus Krumholzibacteria bacterium]MDH5270845.1 transcriptional regulator [Candidatus Krumholzibacteria bacterium]MDH5627161.1 transcriptional regulator [Candidatus Krumholzibacteria bacterium]